MASRLERTVPRAIPVQAFRHRSSAVVLSPRSSRRPTAFAGRGGRHAGFDPNLAGLAATVPALAGQGWSGSPPARIRRVEAPYLWTRRSEGGRTPDRTDCPMRLRRGSDSFRTAPSARALVG